MAVRPHTIDIVVRDMGAALAFYRTLGLKTPEDKESANQAQIATPGGATLGFVTEAMILDVNPHWETPVGQRVTFACECDTPDEVDATYERVTGAGYIGVKEPWDAFWGQRYAFVRDPDGNRVDLFAELDQAGAS